MRMMGEPAVLSRSGLPDAPQPAFEVSAPLLRPVLRNALWLLFGNIAAQALAALMGVLLARRIGPHEYGLYATAFTFAAAFTYAALMGLDSVVPRYVARRPEAAGRILLNALCPALIWLPVLTLIIGGIGVALGYGQDVLTLLFPAALVTGLRGLINLFRSVLRGLERMDLDAAIQGMENGVVLLGVGLALMVAPSARNATFSILLAESLALLVTVLWAGRRVRPRGGEAPLAREMLRASLPIGLTFIMIGLNLRLDTLVLSLFRPSREVGFYSAAVALVMLSRSVALMAGAFLPRLSALSGRDDAAFGYLRDRGVQGALILGTGIGVGMGVLSPFLVHLLYGSLFLETVPSLRVLSIAGIAMFVNTYFWQVLIAEGKQGAIARTTVVSLLMSLPLSLILVPRWGAVGAAAVALVREALQTLLLVRVALRPPRALPARAFLAPFPAAAAMALILWPFREETGVAALLTLLPALLAYMVVLALGDRDLRAELRRWGITMKGTKNRTKDTKK